MTQSRPIRFRETRASVYLDALRAIAAVLVLLSHWRALFFWTIRSSAPIS